jgi:hypothetical protein
LRTKKKEKYYFSGKRNDTEIVKKYPKAGFVKRKNGSIYPAKHSTIYVNKHTRELFGIIRDIEIEIKVKKWKSYKREKLNVFNNYDELLIPIAKSIVQSKELPILDGKSIDLDEETIKKLSDKIEQSEHIIRVKKAARDIATLKHTYHHRRTSK